MVYYLHLKHAGLFILVSGFRHSLTQIIPKNPPLLALQINLGGATPVKRQSAEQGSL